MPSRSLEGERSAHFVDQAWSAIRPGHEELARQRSESCRFLEAELAATVDPRRRAHLLWELGARAFLDQRDAPHAATLLQRALRCDPNYEPALTLSLQLFERHRKWGMVLRLLDIALQQTRTPAQRAALLRNRGALYINALGELLSGRRCYEEAARLDPQDCLARVALLGLAPETPALFARLLRDLSTVEPAGSPLGDALAALAVTQAGRAERPPKEGLRPGEPDGLEPWLSLKPEAPVPTILAILAPLKGAPERARRLLVLAESLTLTLSERLDLVREVVHLMPFWPVGLGRLAELSQERAAADPAVQAAALAEEAVALGRLAELARGPEERVTALLRLAEIRQTQGDDEGAVVALNAALATEPAHPTALALLGRILLKQRDFERLAEMHRRELERLAPGRPRALALLRLARLLEVELLDLQGARDALTEALTLAPDLKAARLALTGLLKAQADLPALIAHRSAELEAATSAEERFEVLCELASLKETHRPDEAALALATALTLPVPASALLKPVRRELARLYERLDRPEALLALYEEELALRGDPAGRLGLLLKAALLAEHQLGDLEKARALLEEAVALAPGDEQVIATLGRVLAQMGDLPAQVALAHHELSIVREPNHAARVAFTLGRLLKRLGDPAGAEQAFEEVLALKPNHREAQDELLALLHRTEREPELLSQALEQARPVREQVRLLLRMATLASSQAPGLAEDALERALSLSPDDPRPLVALGRLFAEREDWAAARELYRRAARRAPTAEEAIGHWRTVARLAQHAPLASSPAMSEALEALEAILALAPRDPYAHLSLTGLYREAGELTALSRTLEVLAELAQSPQLKVAFRLQVAELAARAQAFSDPALAALHYESALLSLPNDGTMREVRVAILDHLLQDGLMRGELDALSSRLDQRLALAPSPMAPRTLERVGAAMAWQGRTEEALRCQLAAAALDPESVVAHEAIHRLLKLQGRETDALVQAQVLAARLKSNVLAVRLLTACASAREGEPSQAAAEWLAVLDREPNHEGALDALRRLAERWGMVDALVRGLELGPPVAARLVESAYLRARRLQDPEEAALCLSRALTAEADPPALQRAGDLAVELQDWPLAIRAYEALCTATLEPALKLAVGLRLAAIEQEKLDQPEGAKRRLIALAKAFPDAPEPSERLLMLALRAEDADLAVQWLDALGEHTKVSLELKVRVAELLSQEGRDDEALGILAGEGSSEALEGRHLGAGRLAVKQLA